MTFISWEVRRCWCRSGEEKTFISGENFPGAGALRIFVSEER